MSGSLSSVRDDFLTHAPQRALHGNSNLLSHRKPPIERCVIVVHIITPRIVGVMIWVLPVRVYLLDYGALVIDRFYGLRDPGAPIGGLARLSSIQDRPSRRESSRRGVPVSAILTARTIPAGGLPRRGHEGLRVSPAGPPCLRLPAALRPTVSMSRPRGVSGGTAKSSPAGRCRSPAP